MPRSSRWLLLVLIGAVAVLSACEASPPQLVLVVNTTVDGPGAQPGDEVCEMTGGAGDCSLRAALDEANAVDGRPVRVVLETGIYALDPVEGPLLANPAYGQVAVVAPAPGARVDAAGSTEGIVIESGLAVVQGVAVTGASQAGFVAGNGAVLILGKGAAFDNPGVGLLVESGARFVVTDTTVSGNAGGGVQVGLGGVFEGIYATVFDNGDAGIGGAGSVSLRASIVAEQASGDDCDATVSSGGFNLDSDGTCALTGTGDTTETSAGLGVLTSWVVPAHVPTSGSPAIDAVADGVVPCEVVAHGRSDQRWLERPQGTGCDRGAVESGSGELSVVVDAAHDAPAANVGDAMCDDGTGACTLRAAVDEANAWPDGAVIEIAAGVDPTLSLVGTGEDDNATGDLDVHGDLRIAGGGATLDAAGVDRAIQHHSGALGIEGLTIRGGRTFSPDHGAGIASAAGTLELEAVTFDDNRAQGSNSRGGALHLANESTTVNASTFIANRATTFSGAGGAIAVAGAELAVTNSTFAANNAWFGSGVHHDTGTVSLAYVTLAGNGGAQTLFRSGADPAVFSVGASIIDASSGLGACNTAVASATSNVASDATCGLTAARDLQNAPSGLDPLGDNGGATLTHLPTAASPANDRVPSGVAVLCDGTTPTDQRGEVRPQGSGCTSGAVETDGASMGRLFVVDAAHDALDANPGDGICDDGTGACTIRAAIDEANAVPTIDTIEIAPGTNPNLARSIPTADDGFEEDNTNALGDLDVHGSLTIRGGGATLTQTRTDRVIDHHEGLLVIEDLTITGGYTQSLDLDSNFVPDGAGMRARADLVLRESVLTGNQNWGVNVIDVDPYAYGGFGGGLHVEGAAAIVERSIISNNLAVGGGGGGISVLNGTLQIVDSTVADNRGGDGADFQSVRGGGVWAGGSQVSIEHSTLVGNEAHGGAGLYATGGLATVTNTTFSANRLLTNVGVTPTGSAVRADGPVSLLATTIAAPDGSPVLAGNGVTLAGSVVDAGGNTACAEPVTSGGYNVVSDASCGLAAAGDVQSTDALLGPLADNGGPTQTHLPWANSPLFEAIPLATAELCDGTVPTDQRGVARPGATGCTIGSVEGASPDPAPL